MSKTAAIVGGLMVVAGIGILVERLIVTDKEAIIAAADHASEAVARGDIAEALRVLHPQAQTEAGDVERTRAAIEQQLRQIPVEKVNFLVNSLKVENGLGTMTIDVLVFPKDPNRNGKVARFRMALEWVKDGEDWKVRKYSLTQ